LNSSEVYDEEAIAEMRKQMRARAKAREWQRKKEERKAGKFEHQKLMVGQVQADVLTVEHLEERIAQGDITKLDESQKKRLMKAYGDCSELLWRFVYSRRSVKARLFIVVGWGGVIPP
jgi:hypothetical protein